MAIRNTPLTTRIAEDIRGAIASKKLSDKKIKDFMKQYYDGDPTIVCPAGCKGDCLKDCYIEIHQALVDDTGKPVPFSTKYLRDSAYHCCGRELRNIGNGNNYCTVCGIEHK